MGAALIVKDEARVLGRCLTSIRPIVDEIVVVDTGSSDDSVAIPRSFGARVLHRPWDGDFSAARNFGLDHMASQWILYIDADEYLSEGSRALVAATLADSVPHVAYRVLLRARVGFTAYREYRVWRNHPDIRFSGVIHESHLKAIRGVEAREGWAIGDIELLIEHDGYEGDQSAKHERNLPLLMDQAQRDPDRSYLWDHIGRIQAALGRHDEARATWEGARERIRRHPGPESTDSLIYCDLINANVFDARPDADLVREADSLFPDNAGVLWFGALDAEARQDFDQVIARLDRLVALGPRTDAGRSVAMDARVFGEWSFHLRGMAYFKVGDFAAAAADFAAAERADPANVEYSIKRQLAQSRRSAHPAPRRNGAE